MSEQSTLNGSRADLLDNGQWHLAINISSTGIGAWLVPDRNLGRAPRTIMEETWKDSDEGLLLRIENAVYDNPTVLDDYSADIIIECDRQLWLPSNLYPSDDDCAEAYVSVYGGDIFDVIVNDLGEEKVAFCLTPGLRSFMQRSFSGARIWSQQSLLKEAAMQPHDACKCLVDIREENFDLVLLERGRFLCAATHPWKTPSDIAYSLINTLETYDISTKDTEIVFSGLREIRQGLGKTLSAYMKSVSQKNHDLDGKTIPSAVYLAINRITKHANHQR